MILSISAFALAVALYAISQLQQQSKLRGQKGDASFWGEKSWRRKYKWQDPILKKEAFPLSSTALVWLTDGYHLMQFFFIKLFVASIILYVPMFSWWVDVGIYLASWYLVFNVTYKVLSK